jgi:thiamine biosynthesis protein ThiS
MITVTVNGEPRELDGASSVTAFLKTLDINARQVAVAVNGEVVPRSEWGHVTVNDGDTVEVVRAVGGGADTRTIKEPFAMEAFFFLLAFGAGVAGATQILVKGAMGEERGVPEAMMVSVTVTYGAVLVFMLSRWALLGELNLNTPGRPLLYLLPLAVIALLAFLGIMRGLEWYYFLGGLAGAFIVWTVAFTGPRIGLAATGAVFIAGQMVAAIVWDHMGLLAQAKDPIDALKVVGVLLIVGGVVLVRGF